MSSQAYSQSDAGRDMDLKVAECIAELSPTAKEAITLYLNYIEKTLKEHGCRNFGERGAAELLGVLLRFTDVEYQKSTYLCSDKR
jgi:hypothetical protein